MGVKDIQQNTDNEQFEILLNRLYLKEHIYGLDNLYQASKKQLKTIDKPYVSKWLKAQHGHQQVTQSNVGKKKEFLPIYANDEYSYQIDLTFLPRYESKNDGYYVLFTAININTRYAYEYHSKDKKGETVLDMLEEFLHNCQIIHSITSDSGSEFINNDCMQWFTDHDIKTYFVVGDSHKLGIINRFHRTLKDKLKEFFAIHDTVRWIDDIDKIIYTYNRTKNRGIGYSPLEASNGLITSQIINKAIDKTKKLDQDAPPLQVGDYCRLRETKKLFDKLKNAFSHKLYKIFRVGKNTVDIENGRDDIIKKVKKTDIIIVKHLKNVKHALRPERQKDIVEKEHKVKTNQKIETKKTETTLLNTEPELEKRVRKANSKYA